MPSQYIVEAAEKAEQWSNDRGTFQAWNIQLMDGKGSYEATTNTKPDKDFPAIGEKVEGDLIPGQRGLRFKRAYAGGGQGNSYKRDPAETASIIRQHSQTTAVYWMTLMHKVYGADAEHPYRPNLDGLAKAIDWFDRDAKGEPQP